MSPPKPKTRTAGAIGDALVLDYDLADLPSSQHRAGLSGLVLMCRWLERQPSDQARGTCVIERLDARSLRLRVDEVGVGALFDQVYAAAIDERSYPKPFKGKEPLYTKTRTETNPKTGKSKEITEYYYGVVVPRGAFLADWEDDGKGPWTKLWRDMLWNILRGVPATRAPFQARAEGAPSTDGVKTFAQLGRPDAALDLPSTYYLGAQAKTAENVPFRDLARHQFLLHFWPFVAQIYVPTEIDNEGKRSFRGYAVAVPDVADLETFCDELPPAMRGRSAEISAYVPAQAVVDLAVESALDFMGRLSERLRSGQQHRIDLNDLVYGVDVFHVAKDGNNVRVLGNDRVDVEETMIDRYRQVSSAYGDSRFRRTRLLNLFAGRPWYAGFDRVFATTPWKQTIAAPWFGRDVRTAFDKENPAPMTTEDSAPQSLETLLYQIVRRYLAARMSSKHQLDWKQVEGQAHAEEDYRKKKKKLAKDAFLAIRSRTGEDFVDYFAGSLMSEPQRLDEARYAALAQALTHKPGTVRTLTLLALSAQG
ncbi:type I-MYXAN CRISPR-associated protein Cmx8 [Haliangium sp.]|uniref:type I-MYXAN CRISPR-associated protein Cmx8 n=1 Tax=Haliangium sp. TaxID=2663208 RepID=UPI003D0D48DA